MGTDPSVLAEVCLSAVENCEMGDLWFFYGHFLLTAGLLFRIECSTEYERLHADIFSGLNKDVWPSQNASSDPIQVAVGVALHEIIDVEESSHLLTSVVWLRLVWEDQRLSWNASEYSGISQLITTSKIWSPDIVLYNDAREEERPSDQYAVKVDSSGKVIWDRPILYTSNCRMDVRFFPFDVQECPLRFGSWSYNGNVLRVYNHTSAGVIDTFEPHSEWSLLDMPVETNIITYENIAVPFIDVTFTIRIRRLASYYVINLIIPILLMGFLTTMNFIMPAESGEKASVSVTLFLSQVVFGIIVGDYMPIQSNKMPYIIMYLVGMNVLMALSTAINIVIINIHHRGQYGTQVPRWLKHYIIYNLGRFLGMQRTVDRYKFRDDKVVETGDEFKRRANMMMKLITAVKPSKVSNIDASVSSGEPQSGGFYDVLLEELRKINKGKIEDEELSVIRLEWSLLATVVNRLCFFIVLLLTLSICIIICYCKLAADSA